MISHQTFTYHKTREAAEAIATSNGFFVAIYDEEGFRLGSL